MGKQRDEIEFNPRTAWKLSMTPVSTRNVSSEWGVIPSRDELEAAVRKVGTAVGSVLKGLGLS